MGETSAAVAFDCAPLSVGLLCGRMRHTGSGWLSSDTDMG